MRELELKVNGMDCAEEVAALRAELAPLVGEANLAFDIVRQKLTVRLPHAADEQAVLAAIARTGLRAAPWAEAQAERAPARERLARRARAALCAASGALLACAIAVHAALHGGFVHALLGGPEPDDGLPLAAVALYLGSVAAGAFFVLPNAFRAARRLRADMNLLMVIAVASAVALGEFFEAAAVSFLFALALLLEAWSAERARRAIAALMDLSPPLARFKREANAQLTEARVEDVPVGALVVVRPGERIPLDGVIVSGETTVDQSPITGESLPVPKEPGDEVFAGTINGEGAIEFRTTKPASDTTLARIIHLVAEAQARRTAAERWVDRFARYYTPAMIALAVLVAVVPPLAFGASWSRWVYQALVILVIACPCALVISTPVSIVAGLTAAARAGVLIKGGTHLEIAARLRAVALDKTGTLTEGRPEVAAVVPAHGHTEDEVLAYAAAIEAHSEHPLAQAVVRRAQARALTFRPAEAFRAIRGKGAQARLFGRPFWIGSHRLMHERGVEPPELHEKARELESSGHSLIALGEEDHVCGLLAIADRLRPAAPQAVRRLKVLGIEKIVVLTGDNEATARAVARACAADEVYAELLPEDKVRAVRKLVERFGVAAMVGDGVNDAPALAASSLGVAMGAAGSDAAIEASDVALMSDDLLKLPWLVGHARRTLHTVKQNVWFALAVKALVMALAFAGKATLWAAIMADTGASLLVIVNGLRLLRPREV